MTLISLVLTLSALFFLELVYFRIADIYNIIDKPNHRSSHDTLTIRGGGVIFGLAALLYFCQYQFQYPYFITGLLLISLISFLDDVVTLNNKIRLIVQLLAIGFMFVQLGLFSMPLIWILIASFFVLGTINAYNFMDGINGITGGYSLVTVLTLLYLNEYVVNFAATELLILTALSLLVFNFFNFRKKAKCFAGDVGSVSIAFIILFLLFRLIITTDNYTYVLLLLLYGLDATITIIFRLIRKEKVFDAHRSHFYQFLANERKMPHLLVASIYAILQLVINVTIVVWLPHSIAALCLSLVAGAIIYLAIRFSTEGYLKLLGN